MKALAKGNKLKGFLIPFEERIQMRKEEILTCTHIKSLINIEMQDDLSEIKGKVDQLEEYMDLSELDCEL